MKDFKKIMYFIWGCLWLAWALTTFSKYAPEEAVITTISLVLVWGIVLWIIESIKFKH